MSKIACRAYQGDFRGWDAYFLENEFVRVVAVPDIGGRIMAYDLGDYAYIYVEPELAGKLFSRGGKPGRRLAGGLEELRRGQNLACSTGLGQ